MPRKKDIAKINENRSIRVRAKDLKNCVIPLNINRTIPLNLNIKQQPLIQIVKKEMITIKFTIFGQHIALVDIVGNQSEEGYPMTEDDDKCMARVDYTNPAKYYIKVNSQGHPYNPIGMYEEGTLNKDFKFKKQWQFREVNKKVFNFYLNFLKTKNKAWINNCARELI